MNFEPEKFFIGLIDFFSILLPGAVLTYLLKGQADLQGTEAKVVFLFVSYVLGHFLFLLGSFLDDCVYDPVRQRTEKNQVTRLLNGRQLSPRPIRWLASVCFRNRADAALERIIPIKESYMKRIGSRDAVNAFQWCKARLALEHPTALATVNRFEADSKFFRSFIPVLIGWLMVELYHGALWLAAGLTVMLALAFWRYMEQRFKSTQQAYWILLTLESTSTAPYAPSEPAPALTHAGGVVFRTRSGGDEFLLVQATTDPNHWVLPKGHIEIGEDARRCAIREVREETGAWSRILRELSVIEYSLSGKTLRVQFYLMESVEEGKPEDQLRRHVWLPLPDAMGKLTHAQSQELLKEAEVRRRNQ